MLYNNCFHSDQAKQRPDFLNLTVRRQMKLSEATIAHIIDRAEAVWRHNGLAKSRKENFLLTLKIYLAQGGVMESVCQNCLGSGYAPNNTIHEDVETEQQSDIDQILIGRFT